MIVYFCEDLADQPYHYATNSLIFSLKDKPNSYTFLLYAANILFNCTSDTRIYFLGMNKLLNKIEELMKQDIIGVLFFSWIVGVLETKKWWT